MNEVIKVQHNGKTYIRWACRDWTDDGSNNDFEVREYIRESDEIDALEADYERQCQGE